jgi:hypothetical protein
VDELKTSNTTMAVAPITTVLHLTVRPLVDPVALTTEAVQDLDRVTTRELITFPLMENVFDDAWVTTI